VVDAVMRGDKAGAVVTDPPYGINLETNMSDIKTNHRGWRGSGKNYPKVIGDDTPFDPSFLFDCFGYCQEMFFWGADYYCEKLPHRNNGSWIVWDKASNEDGGMLKEGAHSQFELCWSRNKHKRSIIRKMWRGLFGTETQDIRSRVHPTQKPIEVLEWIIAKYTDDGDIIFDGFLGSGGTLIACERLGRKCRAIEIMPEYCAITIQRWVDLTGLEPKLLQ
jgi:DNA modification methylase